VRSNAERYFGSLAREAPDASVAVRLPAYAPVEALEQVLQVDRSTLARYNPSLLAPVWEGRKNVPRGHRLYLPHRPGLDPAAILAAIPPERWSSAQVADRIHVVRPGETLSSIAPRYGIRMAELVAANGLRNPDAVRAGQRLVLPACATTSAAERAARNAAAAARAPDVAVRLVSDRAGSQAGSGSAVHAAGTAPAGPDASGTSAGAVRVPGEFSVAYAVGPDGSIRVQEGESLGLYAEWLGGGVDALRRHNGLEEHAEAQVGATLRLPLTHVDRVAFEQRRIAHHRAIREAYLARHRIEGTQEHLVRPGESAWFLAERRYRIPVWLLREYNPQLDLAEVRPGMRVVIPRVSR